MTGDRGEGAPGALPDELATLFAAERSAPLVDASAASVVRAKLTSTVGAAPLGHAAAGGALAAAGKVLAIVAVVAAAAGTFAASHHGERVAGRMGAVIASAPAAEPVLAPPPVVAAPAIEVAPATAPAPPERRAPAPHARARPPAADPTPETAILREAWIAMSAGDAARALALADDDARAHPDGAFVEERDAVRIATLAALGRVDEANAAGTRFLTRYPHSVHRALVERALHREVSP